VLSKNAYNLEIFNCDWYYKTRLVSNSVFTPSAVVTPINFLHFPLIVRIYYIKLILSFIKDISINKQN